MIREFFFVDSSKQTCLQASVTIVAKCGTAFLAGIRGSQFYTEAGLKRFYSIDVTNLFIQVDTRTLRSAAPVPIAVDVPLIQSCFAVYRNFKFRRQNRENKSAVSSI